MSARREQVTAKVVEVLVGAGSLAGVKVERSRDSAVSLFPSLIVFGGGHRASSDNTGRTQYDLDVHIEGWVAADDSKDLEPALNDLYAKTLKAIVADRTLGGLVIDTIEADLDSPIVSRREGGSPMASWQLNLAVQFWTAENDPESPGPAE